MKTGHRERRRSPNRWLHMTVLAHLIVAAGLDAQYPSADSFNPSPSGSSAGTSVSALVVQPDGKILIGGSFTQIGGQGRTNIARLFSNGTVETNFHPVVLGVF